MFYKTIKEKILNKKLILFGELHGTREIPELISEFLSKYAKDHKFNLCLEIPGENQIFIEKFLENGKEDFLKKMPFFKSFKESDGRNSLEYFNLIKNIYNLKKGIKIFCVDVDNIKDDNPQNEREKEIANNIIQTGLKKTTFVIMGNIHASKIQIQSGNMIIKTTGSILFEDLKDKMTSINIWPKKGKYFNKTLKEVEDYQNIKEMEKNYDLTYFLEKATPCTFP